jgi:hypothetical protein
MPDVLSAATRRRAWQLTGGGGREASRKSASPTAADPDRHRVDA